MGVKKVSKHDLIIEGDHKKSKSGNERNRGEGQSVDKFQNLARRRRR